MSERANLLNRARSSAIALMIVSSVKRFCANSSKTFDSAPSVRLFYCVSDCAQSFAFLQTCWICRVITYTPEADEQRPAYWTMPCDAGPRSLAHSESRAAGEMDSVILSFNLECICQRRLDYMRRLMSSATTILGCR